MVRILISYAFNLSLSDPNIRMFSAIMDNIMADDVTAFCETMPSAPVVYICRMSVLLSSMIFSSACAVSKQGMIGNATIYFSKHLTTLGVVSLFHVHRIGIFV